MLGTSPKRSTVHNKLIKISSSAFLEFMGSYLDSDKLIKTLSLVFLEYRRSCLDSDKLIKTLPSVFLEYRGSCPDSYPVTFTGMTSVSTRLALFLSILVTSPEHGMYDESYCLCIGNFNHLLSLSQCP